jgi:hypothetical protein
MGMADAIFSGATRMVYANANATVIVHSPDGKNRHASCSIVVYPRWVNVCFFNNGAEVPDPHRLLQGSGSTVRSLRIAKLSDLDTRAKDLIKTAVEMRPWKYDPTRPITTTIVSVSSKRHPLR